MATPTKRKKPFPWQDVVEYLLIFFAICSVLLVAMTITLTHNRPWQNNQAQMQGNTCYSPYYQGYVDC